MYGVKLWATGSTTGMFWTGAWGKVGYVYWCVDVCALLMQAVARRLYTFFTQAKKRGLGI